MFQKFFLIVKDSSLRVKIFSVLAILILTRFFAAIPIPGVDTLRLEQFLENNQLFFGLLNIFSGGGLSALSIVMLGVGPYITASIIMQVMTFVYPPLKQLLHEEGEAGRRKFTQWTRYLTIPMAILQSVGLLIFLERQQIIADLSLFDLVVNVCIVLGGTMFLTWLGELVSEFGIGNGVSIIIFAGIVASIPNTVKQFLFTFEASQVPIVLAFLAAAVLITAAVVFITEAERPLPVTYAKRVRGMKVYGGVSTYLPLRLNQAGVMPIIFALSILLFPQVIGQFLATSATDFISSFGQGLARIFANQAVYGLLYFFLVVLFTYFYTAVTFDPKSISERLQKGGAFIPGVRPGPPTAHFIGSTLTKITLFGALFLGLVAILPIIFQGITGNQTLVIGGTALLIAVSVVLDSAKKINAQLSLREY